MTKPTTEIGKQRNREAKKRYNSSYLLLCSHRKDIINDLIKANKRRRKKNGAAKRLVKQAN
jgi:hypothetical protein